MVYSSSPVFFAKITAPDGEEFLRMYEFERMKRLFVQIDFHLPDGEDALGVHATIFNQDDKEHSMYWWTNIAIQATRQLRVFSGVEDVLYMDPNSISDNKNPIRVLWAGHPADAAHAARQGFQLSGQRYIFQRVLLPEPGGHQPLLERRSLRDRPGVSLKRPPLAAAVPQDVLLGHP